MANSASSNELHSITKHNNIVISGVGANEVLKFDGSNWINQTLVETGIQATISSSARLNANLIHDGSVSNTEFGHISTLSSNAQTQLTAKAPIASPTFTTGATSPAWITGNDGTVKFNDSDGSHYFTLAANATTTTSIAYTWPVNAGTDNYVLTTNGSGVLTWEEVVGGTSVAGTTDNGLLTFVNSGSTFASESGLTFDGRTLTLSGDGGGYSAFYLTQTSTTSGRKAFMRLRTESSAGGSADPEISFETNGGTSWQVGIDNSQSDRFVICNTGDIGYQDKLRLNTEAAGSDVTVVAGNLVIGTAGKGIDFSATSNAGTTTPDELFDDYEEGTWTPTLTDNEHNGAECSYTRQHGVYTKIGRVVFFEFDIFISAFGGSLDTNDNANVDGLPFTSASTPETIKGQATLSYADSFNITAGTYVCGQIGGAIDYIYLKHWDLSGGPSSMKLSEVSSDAQFSGGGSYRV